MENGGDASYMRTLEKAKRDSTAQLLFKCARVLNEQAVARVRALTDAPGLRAAHMTLMPHVDMEGTRLTELARRMGISKQAVAQLVSDMVEMDILERIQDPSDGRAKLIRFSSQGRSGILHGLSVLRTIEGELGEAIGGDQMDALHGALLLLHDELERRGREEGEG